MSCIWSESQLVSRFWLKLICRDMSQTHNRIAGASISYLCSRSIRSRTRNNIRFLLSYFRFMISSIPLVNYSSPISCIVLLSQTVASLSYPSEAGKGYPFLCR